MPADDLSADPGTGRTPSCWPARGGAAGAREPARAALGDRAPAAPARQGGGPAETPATPLDRLLLAAELAASGYEREALPYLDQYTDERPAALVGWFLRGNCQAADGRDAAAIDSYSVCVALCPDFAPVFYRRGVAGYRLREFRAARANFDVAIRFDPDHQDARIWRALTCLNLHQAQAGLADLDTVLAGPAPPVKAYYYRARLRTAVGQRDLALEDEKAALEHEPADEASWIERGLSRYKLNAEGALEDFRSAERLNPRSVPALHNQVFVLMEKLARPDDAMTVANRALDIRPDYAPSLISRALLFARRDQVGRALQDVELALKSDTRPTFRYQAAGVYAVLSKHDRAHGEHAIRLLAAALRGGYGLSELRNDAELDVLRDWPEFQALVEAAKTLNPENP